METILAHQKLNLKKQSFKARNGYQAFRGLSRVKEDLGLVWRWELGSGGWYGRTNMPILLICGKGGKQEATLLRIQFWESRPILAGLRPVCKLSLKRYLLWKKREKSSLCLEH